MILSSAEMQALENRAFGDGVTAEALMEEAGEKIAAAVRQFCPDVGRCTVFFGKGHNGGDALVAARHLAERGWQIEERAVFPEDALTPLTAQMLARLRATTTQPPPANEVGQASCLSERASRPRCDESNISPSDRQNACATAVLDGLLGIGAGGALREPIRGAAREIGALRASSNARVFALDLPTGLNADSGEADADCVVADCTLTIGFAKRGLLADVATKYVGRLAVLPLAELTAHATGSNDEIVATASALAPLLPRRSFDLHKGACGRVGIIAGSRGLTGAARLTAEACVRAGAGLVTLLVLEEIYPLLAAAAPPEIMVKPVASYREILDLRFDVLAIGPGLGQRQAGEIRRLIDLAPQPMIVDADALNSLAANLHILDRCAGPRLLTPHPGEMARLNPDSAKRSRRATVEAFTARFPHVLLLKGARTLIGQRGQPLSYNITGSPGMATGGMGDVLTGVCAALAGQGLALYDAARLGAWLCGRAAEIAITTGGESEESLTPTALLAQLGAAFHALRTET